MNKDILFEEIFSDFFISDFFDMGESQKVSEPISEVFQVAAALREAIFFSFGKEHLHAFSESSVFIIASDRTVENKDIRGVYESLENEDEGDHELLFFNHDSKEAISIAKVVKPDGMGD
jgi:hypothetical protein